MIGRQKSFLLAISFFCIVCFCYATETETPREVYAQLDVARRLLAGPVKRLDIAQKELYKLIKNHRTELSPYDLCMSYIYLGYIEDNKDNRKNAVKWFNKASMVEGEGIESTRSLAKMGLKEPITWLKHLDEGYTKMDSKASNAHSKVKEQLKKARDLLTGSEKKFNEAQGLLVELTDDHAKELTPYDLCISYIYLGYIEDNKDNRENAVEWFKKASVVEGGNIESTRSLARRGLREPIIWLKHLDGEESPKNQVYDEIGKAKILVNPPAKATIQKKLTQPEMQENFEILIRAIDRYFSFFIHKNIDWQNICAQYREKLEKIKTTRQFYDLVVKFVNELKDSHSWVDNYKKPTSFDSYSPPIVIRRIEGKPVVIDVWEKSRPYNMGVRPGWILTSVNRGSVDRYLERLKSRMPVSSSQRNLDEKVTRRVLWGKEGSMVKLAFLPPSEDSVKTVELPRIIRYPDTGPPLPFDLTKLKSISYGINSSLYGYIRILTFKGRMEIADEFDKALNELQGTKGLIIDIRDNPGGYGTCQERIIGRFLSQKASGIISYRRNGPEHDDFNKDKEFISPCGQWQYEKPLALLMNPITGSASDLFAARFISTGRGVTMGQTTHGNLTGLGVYLVLPCNLVVRISTGYIADAKGRIIEENGNEPEIIIEPTIQDARRYVDGVLDRAFKTLANIE